MSSRSRAGRTRLELVLVTTFIRIRSIPPSRKYSLSNGVLIIVIIITTNLIISMVMVGNSFNILVVMVGNSFNILVVMVGISNILVVMVGNIDVIMIINIVEDIVKGILVVISVN